MDNIPDLLFLTWNRKEYAQRTLTTLLENTEDFRLYCWDNGSKDGTAEFVASLKDDRIVERFSCPVNVRQAYPTQWLLEKSQSSLIGKVDDDTLLPHGWISRLSEAVLEIPQSGMIGCWTFWPEDYERNKEFADKNIISFGQHKILQSCTPGGTAFLMRKDIAEQYYDSKTNGNAFPISRVQMTKDGLINGWIFPLLWVEHMDDPRSEHCLMNRSDKLGRHAALTARTRGFQSAAEYQKWIMSDADWHLRNSVSDQLHDYAWKNSRTYRILHKLKIT